MRKNSNLTVSLSHRETLSGFLYLALQLLVLPNVLYWGSMKLGYPLNDAELNFLFYLINFLAMLVIFHDYLGSSLRQALRHPAYLCQAVILGLAAYYVCNGGVMVLINLLSPSYANHNDEAILAMRQGNDFLMLVCTVVLVPPFEECMYRGLIFRNLYGRNRWAAYAVSILLFCLIHILGYIRLYSPMELLLALLQYLPAGLCLAWSYTKADTIFAPILMHSAINFITLHALR